MKFRIKFADKIVGVFVVLACVLLIFMLLALGGKQRWFAKDAMFYSRFPSGYGLSVGMAVQLKGFKIGRISHIALNEENEAEICFEIYKDYRDKIKKNSILELNVSPIGLGNSLNLHPGFSQELLEDFDFIPSYDLPAAQRLVELGLVNRPPKDDSISRILSNINPLLENLNTSVVQINSALAGLNGLDGRRIDLLMDGVQERLPLIFEELASSMQAINYIVENLKGTSEVLRDPTGLVPTLLDPKGSIATLLNDNDRLFNHIEGSLAQVELALANLRASTESLSTSMPYIGAAIEQVRSTLDNANDVLIGVKNNPLIRGGVPEKLDAASVPDAGRTAEF